MLHYILQIIFFQLFFLLGYELFLKKETFFNYNRIYLLLTPILALIIPWLQVEFIAEAVPTDARIILPEPLTPTYDLYTYHLPAVVINGEKGIVINWWLVTYLAGFIVSILLLLKKYQGLKKYMGDPKSTFHKGYKLIEIPDSTAAYTFFNTIFLGDQLTAIEKNHILSHELVHVKHKHSYDLVFFEVLKVIFWFNPLIYIYQSKIAGLHEFIADEEVVRTTEKKTYYQQLLNTAFNTQNISFINQFFNHSLIKKRIFMLQKSKSSQRSKFKFLLILPLMLAMLTYVACSDNKTEEEIDSSLSQFDYSLNKDENLDGNLEKKQTHEAYEKFLINNPDYVSWATIDYESDQVSYSIHKASEKVPEGYNKMVVSSKDGNEYTMYMNLKATGLKSTSATKNPGNFNSEEFQNMPELVLNDKEKNQNFNTENAHPFATIDIAPAFPGCEELSGESRKECTSQKISTFIIKHFNSNIGNELNIKGFNRILVLFKIDQTGKIVETRARATHNELKEEAIRVINNLPNMVPGQHNGKKVTVTYTLPIVFQINE